jgi:hypothetical protein
MLCINYGMSGLERRSNNNYLALYNFETSSRIVKFPLLAFLLLATRKYQQTVVGNFLLSIIGCEVNTVINYKLIFAVQV